MGLVTATRIVPFAWQLGPIIGAAAGVACAPFVLLCLRRKDPRWTIPAVYGSSCVVALLASSTGNPIWTFVATVPTLLGQSIVARFLLPDSLRVYDPGCCQTCGYNLTGNLSGICPECGTPIARDMRTAESYLFHAYIRVLLFLIVPFTLCVFSVVDSDDRSKSIDPTSLIERLAHHDMEVQWQAKRALMSHGKTPLLSALQHTNPRVRANAAEALGWLADATTVPDLISALGDEDAHTRMRATRALGKIADSSATPHLVNMLDDDDMNVRLAAIEAIATITTSGEVSARRSGDCRGPLGGRPDPANR